MITHLPLVGDALHITIPVHKGDQEGSNSHQRNLFANPLDICPILSLAVYVFCKSFSSFLDSEIRVS